MRVISAAIMFAALTAAARAQGASGEPWHDSDLLQPARFAALLADSRAPKPKILYVGFGVLYRSKHIPGAVFAGPTEKQEGLEAFRSAIVKLPRTSEIVIYCGCCPVAHCPNLRPAFLMLRELGFKNAKILWLPSSFLKDWIDKGYPVESGQS